MSKTARHVAREGGAAVESGPGEQVIEPVSSD
jgi:hypothetical protein